MKKRFNKLSGILICITFAIFLLFLKDNVPHIWKWVCSFAEILTPFIYAFGIAYILNFPFRFFQNKVFGKIKSERFSKLNKPLSLLCTYLLFVGLFVFFLAILIPQLFDNVSRLSDNIPSYVNTFKDITNGISSWLNDSFNVNVSFLESVNNYVKNSISSLSDLSNLKDVYDAAMNTAGVVYDWVMALILSIYMLGSKEFLCAQLKRLGAAFLPTKWLPTIYEIINVSDDKCGKFLVGKILDSTIIGVMVFIYMAIRGLPYAPLISVIVGVCNIIPFFGPFIGGVPSAFLLLLVNPVYCLEFVIMLFIVQQIDGNIIGPKIVGAQVGLVGFWSLFSVMVAGGLFGITGMILGTPIFAAIYTLVGRKTNSRIRMKGENAERVIEMDVVKSSGLTNMKAKVLKYPKKSKSESEHINEEEE